MLVARRNHFCHASNVLGRRLFHPDMQSRGKRLTGEFGMLLWTDAQHHCFGYVCRDQFLERTERRIVVGRPEMRCVLSSAFNIRIAERHDFSG